MPIERKISMKNYRCSKLIVLLLAILIAAIAIPAMAEEDGGKSSSPTAPFAFLATTNLNDGFMKADPIIVDANNKTVADFSAADPNGTYTLKLNVANPANAGDDDAKKLPSDTSKVVVYYTVENMKAAAGTNGDVSWTFNENTKQIIFTWPEGEKTSFTANIAVTPNYPAVYDFSGGYILVAKTGVMLTDVEQKLDARSRTYGTKVTINNGSVRPAGWQNTVWTLTHVTGEWYTISSNNGRYMKLGTGGSNGNNLFMTSAEGAQKIRVQKSGDYYIFSANGQVLDNSGGGIEKGFSGWTYNGNTGSANDNEKFTLYPASSLNTEPTSDLEGTWGIVHPEKKAMMSTTAHATAGRLTANLYTVVDGEYLPYDSTALWQFENVTRDWYYISSNGKYLNISNNGVLSLGDEKKPLWVTTKDNFNTVQISSEEFANRSYGVSLKNAKLADGFGADKYSSGNGNQTLALAEANKINNEEATISGSWAIVTESSGAALLTKANGTTKLSSAAYFTDDNGAVFAMPEKIETFTFTKLEGNWYTIQAQDGKYLMVSNAGLALSNSENKVYIQVKDGKYRITNGNGYALNNSGNNATGGYSSYNKDNGTAPNEWHVLRAVNTSIDTCVAFNVNGGTVSSVPSAIMGIAGQKVTLPDMDGTKDGQAFIGWMDVTDIFKANNGVNHNYHEVYKPGTSYTMKSGVNTLYALYNIPVKQVQFGIRQDGVIQDEPNNYDAGAYKGHFIVDGSILKETHWVIDIDSTKSVNGYYINNDVIANLNWIPSAEQIADALKKEGNIDFDPNTQYIHYYVIKPQKQDMVKVDGVIRNKASVEVSYNANAPEGVDKTQIANMPGGYQVISGTEILIGTGKNSTEIKTPSVNGYVFGGWNTERDGSGTEYSAGHYVRLQGNLNLYAQWIPANNGEMIIVITSDWPDGKLGFVGAEITLKAELTGFEGKQYTLQWQYAVGDSDEWIDIPNTDSLTYTFKLNEVNTHYSWRCVARNVR